MTPQIAEIALADIKDFLIQLLPNNLVDIAKLETEEQALNLLRHHFTEQELAVIQHELMFAPSDTYEGMSGHDILGVVNARKQQSPSSSRQKIREQTVKIVSVSGTEAGLTNSETVHAASKLQNIGVKVSPIETATSAVSDKLKAVDEEG